MLAGWLEASEYTSGTDGLDEAMLDVSSLSIYRMPIDSGTFALADVGDYCDLAISSNIQGLNVSEGVEGTLIIVKKESASVALVRMNPSKITGAAAAGD